MMSWRRFAGWTLTALGVLLLVGALGGYLFLESNSFRRTAIRTIVKDANEATGGRTEIGGLDIQLSTLTARLYNITLHGTESPAQPPLLRIDKLTVGIRIESLLRRKVSFGELEIEHPVAHVFVDLQGHSNIPSPPPTASNSTGRQTNVFDLAARHVLLTGGEITYNDTTTPLEAELYGLRTEIGFDPLATRYHGSISYSSGLLRYANDAPFQHSLDANFDATPSRFTLDSAKLNVGSSAISLHAELADYSNPTIEGEYDIRIHTQDFAAMAQPIIPAGDLSLAGTLHYHRVSDQPLLQNIASNGQVESARLVIRSSDGQVDVRKLQGKYQLLNGVLQLHDMAFNALDGRVVSDVGIQNLDKLPIAHLRTTMTGISLRSVQHAVRKLGVPPLELLGKVDGTVEASWTDNISNIRAHTDLRVLAPASSELSSKAIPLSGAIHASYDGSRNIIGLSQTTLHIPSLTIDAQGQLGSRSNSNLQIRGNASDLHQLSELLGALRGGHAPTEITGAASFQAVVRGSMQKPTLTGQVEAHNLQVEGSEWSSASFKVQASSSEIVLQEAGLVSAHQGNASLSAHVGLTNWSYLPSSPISGSLAVQRLSIADLQHLANLHYPVSGDLSAKIFFHGSQLQPAGNGTATIDNARAYGEAVHHFAATFRTNQDSLVSTLEVIMPAGSARGTISYTPKTKAYRVRLDAPSVALQKLQIVEEKNLGIAGTLQAAASGEGTLDNPQLTATVAIPRLQLRDKSISQLKGELHITNERAEWTLDSNVAQASVRSRGTVNLAGDYYAEATIDTGDVSLNPLLAMYVPNLPPGFQGETELHATLKGPLKDKLRIEAHVTIPMLKASYQSLEIGATSPIRVDYDHSVIMLQPAEIHGTATSLRLQGNIPLNGSSVTHAQRSGLGGFTNHSHTGA